MPRLAAIPLVLVTAALTAAISAGAALGLAEEPQGAGAVPKPVPAQPILARDYSIGTLAPEDTTTQQAVPDAAPAPANGTGATPAKAPDPQKRPRYAGAILQAVDKVTAESVRFEAPIGQPVRYKGLIYMVKACETTADDEAQPRH